MKLMYLFNIMFVKSLWGPWKDVSSTFDFKDTFFSLYEKGGLPYHLQ